MEMARVKRKTISSDIWFSCSRCTMPTGPRNKSRRSRTKRRRKKSKKWEMKWGTPILIANWSL